MKYAFPLPWLFVSVSNASFRRHTIILAILCSLALQVQAQTIPIKQWDKTLGGPADDYLRAVVPASDGGYLLGGYSFQGLEGGEMLTGNGFYDYLLVKVDAEGNREWEKMYGGTGFDFLYSVTNTPDGGYLLGGYSLSDAGGDKSDVTRGDYDYWIIKIDENGNKEWDKSYGGTQSDLLYSVLPAADGGYLLAGSSSSGMGGEKSEESRGSSDYWIIKIDEQGDRQWDKTFGGEGFENFKNVVNAPGGGYLLGGSSESGISGDKSEAGRGAADFWIVKIDEKGNKVWDKTFGGNNLDELNSVVATSDGNYLLGGNSYSDAGADKSEKNRRFSDYWVVMINANGEKLWDKVYGGTGSDYLLSVVTDPGGGFYLAGSSGSGGSEDKSEASKGEFDFWIVHIDEAGTKQWDIVYGGTKSDNLVAMIASSAEEYLLAGQSNSGEGADKSEHGLGSYDFWLVKSGATPENDFQHIEFDEIPDHMYGDDDFQVNATSGSDLALVYSVSSGPATIVENTVTITGAGVVVIQASLEANSSNNPGSSVSRTFTVYKASPDIIWEPLVLMENELLGSNQLNARAEFNGRHVEGSFTYYPSEGTLPGPGLHTLVADFIPADAANFTEVTGITSLVSVEAAFCPFLTSKLLAFSGSGKRLLAMSDRKPKGASAIPGDLVFPNPFKNVLTVNFKTPRVGKVPVSLYNIQGQEVLRMPNISSGQKITVGDKWKPGVYFLRVGSGIEARHYKLIKTD